MTDPRSTARVLGQAEVVAALRAAGLRSGDVVLVQSDLRTIGPVAGPPVELYVSALEDVLGPTGTLVVCTAFEDYGRFGTPFDRESSPSRLGVLSEHVRTRPGAVRSMHPIVSLAATGRLAIEICGGPHYDGFGFDSPWGILHRLNAKLLLLGLRIRRVLTFVHYIEHLYGVPYQYTKLYTTPVYASGTLVPGTFTMSVRYLDFSIAYDFRKFEDRLREQGLAVEIPLGRSVLQMTTANDALRVGIELLREDRYGFLVEPPRFRRGAYPFDGPTGPMRTVVDKAMTGRT